MANRAAIFLRKARAVARKCHAAGVPSPFTVNASGQLTVNPAVSEAQRRYLNATFGHDWVKEHHFDNHGPLPDKVDGKKRTKEENERRLGFTENESNFFGRFWHWLTNAKSKGRDDEGKFAGDDEADEAEASEKGMSVEELRKLREAGPATNRRRQLVANARRCPECGGKMEDGECMECDYTENQHGTALGRDGYPTIEAGGLSGADAERLRRRVPERRPTKTDRKWGQDEEDDDYEENAALMVDQDADHREGRPSGGDADPDGRHTSKLHRQKPIDVIDDDGDPYLDEDDHSDLVREDQIRDTRNAQGYMGPDPHDATKQAVASTVMSEHTGARDHAMEAMDASADDDSGEAAKMHLKAAKVHEDAATGARGDGEHMEADNHDQAAALHRKAASMHKASMSFNRWFSTNMPAGGAFSGAKAAGYSAAQAAAMAGKLEGSYDSSGETGKGGSTPTREAKDASAHADRTKSKSAHKRAAQAHKSAAEHHEAEGNTEMAQSHRSAARSHAAKAARMTRNSGMTRNQWINLLMHDPLITTNMPAGGAFSGAKAAGYSAAQAAAMAGKLEGSYGESSGVHKEAKEASAHAERTKSKSAHKRAAAKHEESAKEHTQSKRPDHAKAAKSAARSHRAKAARATRNEYLESLIENCTCPATAYGLQRLLENEASAIGEKGGELFAGRQEGNDEPYDGDDDDEFSDDVKLKKHRAPTDNAFMAQLPPEIRETIQEAQGVVRREKSALVQRLTANIRNPTRREYRIHELMGRGLKELRGMLELVGNSAPPEPQSNGDGGNDMIPLFGPGNGDFVDNSGGGGDDDNVLDCPTINFQPRQNAV